MVSLPVFIPHKTNLLAISFFCSHEKLFAYSVTVPEFMPFLFLTDFITFYSQRFEFGYPRSRKPAPAME